MFDKIKLLKDKNYIPDIIFDIGAHHGQWTNECLKIYPNSKYILFEAINYSELNNFRNKDNITVFNELLNDKIEIVNWYEMRNTGDSIFKEKTYHFDNCNVIRRTSNTLNNIIESKQFIFEKCNKILIKIDCQGAEIPILKGSTDILDKTDFIILEIPLFGQYNEGVPNFLEHIKFMDSNGFVPYDIIDNHYINTFNMQVDMMFINKKHHFNSLVQKTIK